MRRRQFSVLFVSLLLGGLSQAGAQQSSDEPIQTVPAAAPTSDQIDAAFGNEPTLLEVYAMASKEAGLHPERIEKWIKASNKKYWFPDLRLLARKTWADNFSESPSFSIVQNPDRVIERDENDYTRADNNAYQIEATAVWSLPELIFDRLGKKDIVLTQSRVLALRQALIERLSDAYYQRRRLQVELRISPPAAPLAREIMQLRIQELTAQLDMLTAGGFTGRVQGGGQ